jgi:glycosyltransferase involved in cell wall biosynthesis
MEPGFQFQGKTMSETELMINVSKLKGKKVMLATPMYGGLGNSMYFSSVLRLQDQFIARGIAMHHAFMANESLIDRARNGLANEFLTRSNADYLLFIDADIQFQPEDVLAMMSYEKDVMCGPYPKKAINWKVIIEAVKAGFENPATLEKLVGEYVFTPLGEEQEKGQIVRVAEAGTGLMLIHRDVFAKMEAAFPENYYLSDHSTDVHTGTKKPMHAFFRTAIVDNRYLSEDYYFCHKWREIGGDVWLFPWAQTTHYGMYGFQGSVGHLIDTLNKIGEKKNGA